MNKNAYYDILMAEVTKSVTYRVFGLERFDDGQRVFLHNHPRLTRWFCIDRNNNLYTPSEYERMKYFVEETQWRDERIDEIMN